MITIQQSGDVYSIKSKYDEEFISLVKAVPGRSWNPDSKVWIIHKDKLFYAEKELHLNKWTGSQAFVLYLQNNFSEHAVPIYAWKMHAHINSV